MRHKRQHLPGEPAEAAGEYQQLRVLGSATGVRVAMLAGQSLPAAPIGFTWVRVENHVVSPPPSLPGQHARLNASRVRAEAAVYRRLAATARTAMARNELAALATRLAAVAALLEAKDSGGPDEQPNVTATLDRC